MNRDTLVNGVGTVGLGLFALGLWLLSPAWALVIVGAVLVGFGVVGARR